MAWWSRWLERRTEPSWKLSELDSWDDMGIGAGPTASGITVTPERALQVPAVFACIQTLSQDIARTPIKFKRKIAEDTFVDATEHDLFEILGSLANPEQTAYEVKHALQWQLLLFGRAYAEIVRVDGRITALWPLRTEWMRVDRTPERRIKRYTYTADGKPHTWLFDPSQPPILELVHETPLVRCREILGLALALQQYTSTFFANGARPGGILTSTNILSQSALERVKASWVNTHQGTEKSHRVAILDGGLDYKALAANNDDSQLNEMMQVIVQQICGTFRIPPWKVGSMQSTNYSNMESGERAYVDSTLDPYFAAWEDALKRDLLTNRQFNSYTATFDRNALIRSDVKAKHEALAIGINAGYYSPNDARTALGLNPVDGGDIYRFNTALQPLTGAVPHAA